MKVSREQPTQASHENRGAKRERDHPNFVFLLLPVRGRPSAEGGSEEHNSVEDRRRRRGGRKNKLRRRGKEGRKGGGDENLLSDARDAAAHSGIRRSRSNIGIEIVRRRERSEISEVIANSRN